MELPAEKPIIEMQGVVKRYGSLTVLDGLDLDIRNKEILSIIGPSGSGKTTVLRVLMTLEKITEGIIKIDGQPLTHMKRGSQLVPADERHLRKMRANIGMVFQQFNLFPHMTALANCMEGPIHVQGISRQEARDRAIELLTMVGLEKKVNEHPARLSGGQQQRVAIARAMAMRPKILLFDEVTSALDPEVVGEVLTVIRRLGTQHSLTMVMVTHQMGFAREISDRVCFFHAGKIAEQGTPEQIFGAPQNARTQQFLKAVVEGN